MYRREPSRETGYFRSADFASSIIYVDEPQSVASGREVWGLPKEIATFEWYLRGGSVVPSGSAVVRREGRVLCALDYRPRTGRIPARVPLPAVSVRGHEVLSFVGDVRAGVRMAGARVEVPPQSPFGLLGLGGRRGRLAVCYDDLTLLVPAPTVVGEQRERAGQDDTRIGGG